MRMSSNKWEEPSASILYIAKRDEGNKGKPESVNKNNGMYFLRTIVDMIDEVTIRTSLLIEIECINY